MVDMGMGDMEDGEGSEEEVEEGGEVGLEVEGGDSEVDGNEKHGVAGLILGVMGGRKLYYV